MEYVQPSFNIIYKNYFASLLYSILDSNFLENILIMSIHENAVTNKVQTDALCMGVVLFKSIISRF